MEIVQVSYIGSDGQYQAYQPSDKSLINTSFITPTFGNPNDYIEYYIKDQTGIILSANYFNTRYKVGSDLDPQTGTTTTVYLDPEADARDAGYNRGIVDLKYNFFRTYLLSSPATSQNFWIKEVSSTRTEIKTARQDLSNTQLETAFLDFNASLTADAYYPDFYLNFGNDEQVIGVNAVYVEEDGSGYVIFKLYEPLPPEFDIKSRFWVVTAVADPAEFNVSINVEPEAVQDVFQLKGPNYRVSINNAAGQTTPYYNYQTLFNTTITSSYQQLKSMMDEKGININVDYSDFSNFIHFSSATERLQNFVYKIGLIEAATAGIAATSTVSAKISLQASIDNIITKFDGYEYYLYYASASTAWPKINSTQPYDLYSVTSSQVLAWLGSETTEPSNTGMSMYYSSSLYDNTNSDLLQYSMPAYLRDDSSNDPFMTFLNMIGQHFDNLWIYLKDVTNRYSAENNPFAGISMDQVAEALRSMGVQLYTNTSISDNIYYSLFGINPDGTLLPPTGSEVITNYVTSSLETLPGTQITNEYYKRLYHNLAYLLKTRGTERGIKALVTTFGIPENVLQVNEYGGYDIYSVPGIQEVSKNKILTSSGVIQVQTNLLSPDVTLQYYQNDTMKSSINLEIGFSPADSINASITGSQYVTSSTQPGYFNIMQFIGDPRLQYSSSYEPLVKLSNTYFSSSYNDRYNVWDYIRVIKYYNNSLFKMLRDWVPARASATTGIIIKSHMLERNKYARHEPTVTTSSHDAYYELLTVSGSDGGSVIGSTAYVQAIPVQYSTSSAALMQSPGTIFVSSSDDVQKYTGEFSGSTIEAAPDYFNQDETSTYRYPTLSSIPGPVSVMFTTYSLGAVYQNVTQSVISQRFLDLDYNSSQLAPVNYNLITRSIDLTIASGSVIQSTQPFSQYAQLQDFNYNQRASVRQKYSGSTLSGLRYNVYSTDDESYGNDPVINYNTNKLGLFTQVYSSSFLPGKVNIALAYLADVSGGLFELNQDNKHWQDVQNIFKEGSTLNIKQFDNRKYSNQTATDGLKTIYNSGYSYTPQLYYKVNQDSILYFRFINQGNAGAFTARNSGDPNNYISGFPNPKYEPVVTNGTSSVYNIFDQLVEGTGYTPGNKASRLFPTYSIDTEGIKTFTARFDLDVEVKTNGITGSYTLAIKKNGINQISQSLNFLSISGSSGGLSSTIVHYMTSVVRSTSAPPPLRVRGPFSALVSAPGWYGGPSLSTVGNANSYIDIENDASYLFPVWNYITNQYDYIPGTSQVIVGRSSDLDQYGYYFPLWSSSGILNNIVINPATTFDKTRFSQAFNLTTPAISLTSADNVTFELFYTASTTNITASISTGTNSSLTVGSVSTGQGNYSFARNTPNPFIQDLSNTGSNAGVITYNSSLSQYRYYEYVPYFPTGSTEYRSALYNTYGDVNTVFNPEVGDAIVLRDANGLSQILDVIETTVSGSNLITVVTPAILTNWTTNETLIDTVQILKKIRDEQNVIINFNKPSGQTSYGFIIPETIKPEVLQKINTLQASVQSQLIEFQGTTGT